MTALIGFYGDDLTGSTDTLSVLARGGLTTRLFLETPSAAQLASLDGVDAIGIAGAARTMTPREMDEALPAAFAALRAGDVGDVKIVHYKTCSTFDSAPEIGSIGHAMAIAAVSFGRGFVPIVVGQPSLGRYCAFGTLFATAGPHGPAYRLDRHPTMSCHPVTPMGEADLRLHLAKQGMAHIALVDFRLLADDAVAVAALNALLRDQPDGVLFDVLESAHLRRIGRLIGARLREGEPIFAVGSSAVQQALLAGWSEAIARQRPGLAFAGGGPAQVLIVSGSRSPVTASQIGEAQRGGFALVALDPVALVAPAGGDALEAFAGLIESQLREGRSVIAHTSLGPDDPRGAAMAAYMDRAAQGEDGRRAVLRDLAAASGRLMQRVLQRHPLRRAAIVGGDTSSLAARALGVEALAYAWQISSGSPMCRVAAPGTGLDGLELLLKGGQMGDRDVFERLRSGAGE
jgi:uncharacterized protein YgbK (DUF1537 family)